MSDCVLKYVSASFFPGTSYILLGKEVSRWKEMRESGNEFLLFGETLSNKLSLLPKKYHLIKFTRLNSCLPLKDLLIFFKNSIDHLRILKISELMNLCKSPEIYETALFSKSFFLNVNRKGIYFICVRLKSRKAELKQRVKVS